MRRWAVRLRDRRGCVARPGAAACVGVVALAGWACWLLACSCGKSSCVGETLGPRVPFWRVVSTVSDDVAVVVCGAPSILAVSGQSLRGKLEICAVSLHVPSDSEPASELRPLQLWPRLLAKMAEPSEYSDEKEENDRRLLSAASTSGRCGRNASGSMSAFTGARLARAPSSVGVVSVSVSSMAESWLLPCPKNSRKLLSDAFDGRRGGICRIACDPDGGSETLTLPTLSAPISGSLDLAFLSAGDDPLAAMSCCHDRVLSTLTVRDSVFSMPAPTSGAPEVYV
jgi:hypothetical protein